MVYRGILIDLYLIQTVKYVSFCSAQFTAIEGARLIERAKVILKKARRKIPVGTAEAWHILEFGATTNITSKVSDFLCMNMQSYWGGFAAECLDGIGCGNLGTFVDSKADVLNIKYGKKVIICSTGWPTFGESCCGQNRPGSLDGFQVYPQTCPELFEAICHVDQSCSTNQYSLSAYY